LICEIFLKNIFQRALHLEDGLLIKPSVYFIVVFNLLIIFPYNLSLQNRYYQY